LEIVLALKWALLKTDKHVVQYDNISSRDFSSRITILTRCNDL